MHQKKKGKKCLSIEIKKKEKVDWSVKKERKKDPTILLKVKEKKGKKKGGDRIRKNFGTKKICLFLEKMVEKGKRAGFQKASFSKRLVLKKKLSNLCTRNIFKRNFFWKNLFLYS